VHRRTASLGSSNLKTLSQIRVGTDALVQTSPPDGTHSGSGWTPWLTIGPDHSRAALTDAVAQYRRLFIAGIQLSLVVLSNYVAFWLRFDGAVPAIEWTIFIQALPWLVAIRGSAFVCFKLYAGPWRYTGLSDLCSIIMAVASSTAVASVILLWALRLEYSRSVLIIDSFLLIVFLSGIRLSTRIVRLLLRKEGYKRVLIYGAGDSGEMIVRDMRGRPYGYEPIGFIDDNPAKLGQRIHGVPVLGGRQDLGRIIATGKPHELLVAIPSADPLKMQAVVKFLQPFKVPLSTLPSVRDILGGRVAVNQIRQLTIADLLPRAPVDLDTEAVRRLIAGSAVMVTGAGGSIGAELSRQIAAFKPAVLVLYERYENTLHELVNDLVDRSGSACVRPVIGDVTDSTRVHQVLEQFRPQIVFHAAAHKHVPLMEHNPCEAVKNNVVGTATVATAATRCGVERFILISTDKAVNPSSVMGATKRVAELIVQMMGDQSTMCFSTVRFGNVLGSNGSVLPRFLSQIRAGGPVTVTHREIRRYFMLIPEAVQLVLHAATLDEPGMTYVLDMGEQIKVVELARNVIRLAGFVPEKDIPIAFVGLRPGEKLFEELLGPNEKAEPSSVEKILRVRGSCRPESRVLNPQLLELVGSAMRGDSAGVIRQLRRIVPEFEPLGDEMNPETMTSTSYLPSYEGRLAPPNHVGAKLRPGNVTVGLSDV
jgi:FlaA1/EpsC-like NDP-sugar epimerase